MIELSHSPAKVRESSSENTNPADAEPLFLNDQVRRPERDLITKALNDAEGKKAVAAEQLGIFRRTFWKKTRNPDITNPSTDEDE